jgi:SSS family solute:Na+ symporter
VAMAGCSSLLKGDRLSWEALPDYPASMGVASPFSGVHNNVLLVAGGANFPTPVWENDKAWHDSIHVLVRNGDQYAWKDGGKLPRPIAYGAAVSTTGGIVCIGGNDADETFREVFLLRYDRTTGQVEAIEYPKLPLPCAFGSAALVGDVIYLAGGQSGLSLDTAMNNFWSLDMAAKDDGAAFAWKQHDSMPGPTRALNVTVAQHDGDHPSVYVISGRRQQGEDVQFLKDVWQYTPATDRWRRRADAPRCVMAGTGIEYGKSQLFVLGGADGSLFFQGDQLRDNHPGFPKQALAYHTVTDTWTSAGAIPQNHVTTIAVKWDDAIIIPSGEVRPRVRSPKIWRVTPVTEATEDDGPGA